MVKLWVRCVYRTLTCKSAQVMASCDREMLMQVRFWWNNNLLLTVREGRTGEYWPEAVAVRTECSEVRTKTSEGQYSPVRFELARLVSILLYGTRAMLVLNLPAFRRQKIHNLWPFHGNGPYAEIPTKEEPIRTLGFDKTFYYMVSSMSGVDLLRCDWLPERARWSYLSRSGLPAAKSHI